MTEDESTRKGNLDCEESIGDRIRHWRSKADMRPVDLARRLSMSESSVSKWENDLVAPGTQTLQKIVDACEISMQTFWGPIPEEGRG